MLENNQASIKGFLLHVQPKKVNGKAVKCYPSRCIFPAYNNEFIPPYCTSVFHKNGEELSQALEKGIEIFDNAIFHVERLVDAKY